MTEETKTEELTEEEQLAQDALPATEEKAPEKPAEQEPEVVVDPKDAVIGEFRRGLRDANTQIAELKAAQVKPDVKSPMEIAQAQAVEAGVTLEFTPELYNAQRQFEQAQTQAQTQEQAYAQQKREYDAGLTTVPQVEIDQLIAVGGNLLTEGDKQNVWEAGKNSGKELKRILNHRIELAGLQSKPKVKTKAKTEDELKAEAKKKAEDETPPEDEEEKLDPVTARGVALFYKD
jgi:hypothetical protein